MIYAIPHTIHIYRYSGLRVGRDGKDHQYCKQLTFCMLPSTKRVLNEVPFLRASWKEIRKSHDPEDVIPEFTERAAARDLAVELGFSSGVDSSFSIQSPTQTDDINTQKGWFCFACPSSNVMQSFDQTVCTHCGKQPDWVETPTETAAATSTVTQD